MSKKTSLPSEPPVRCIRMVRRLVRTWRKRAKEYSTQAMKLAHQGQYQMAHDRSMDSWRVAGLADELEGEMSSNAKADLPG